ncbi:MAG: AAA family ATPase [Deltaproteobacteria bacterium]|jgi:hypothetical protein|nr:AAA family ATPase [Deltaproteobacteria bacterium]
MALKNLSVGAWTFANIIDRNILYADKTKYIYDLLNANEKDYFLSRPRRFGKTLLLYTLEELFSGNRERFKGLWIDASDYDFKKHPVIFFSLSLESRTPDILMANINNDLKTLARKAELELTDATPATYFGNLIQALSEKSKSEVVVLIDEYDAPVTRNMAHPEIAQSNADILHDFFATLKKVNVAPLIHFTFVTGITRYALTSMDSGANHLIDISLNPQFAGICGFTLEEFDSLFSERLPDVLASLAAKGEIKENVDIKGLKSKILDWYNGYNWEGPTKVLNPYSIINFFKNTYFDNFWILSGRPGRLSALIKEKPQDGFVRNMM